MGHLKSFFSLSHKIRFAKLWDKKIKKRMKIYVCQQGI
jgi:hypothetical protein